MSKKQQQQNKKKKREEHSKNRVLYKRNKLREKMREEKEKDKILKEVNKMKPFVKEDHPANIILPNKDDEDTVKNRLKKHLENITNIHNEMLSEDKARTELNERLEDEGQLTIKEKMEYMQEKVKKGKMQGSAMVEFKPNS